MRQILFLGLILSCLIGVRSPLLCQIKVASGAGAVYSDGDLGGQIRSLIRLHPKLDLAPSYTYYFNKRKTSSIFQIEANLNFLIADGIMLYPTVGPNVASIKSDGQSRTQLGGTGGLGFKANFLGKFTLYGEAKYLVETLDDFEYGIGLLWGLGKIAKKAETSEKDKRRKKS